jgi:hypothetical protein
VKMEWVAGVNSMQCSTRDECEYEDAPTLAQVLSYFYELDCFYSTKFSILEAVPMLLLQRLGDGWALDLDYQSLYGAQLEHQCLKDKVNWNWIM